VILFGSIFSGGNDQRTIGFADQDASPASQTLASAFGSVKGVKLVDSSVDDLLARMKRGEISAVIALRATDTKGEPMPAPEAQQIVTDFDRQLLAVPDNA